MGFKLNPYDSCDGIQCTTCWYLDDNKISNMKRKVVEDVISKIEDKFGVMSKTYGDEHEFLGMNIKYRKPSLDHRKSNVDKSDQSTCFVNEEKEMSSQSVDSYDHAETTDENSTGPIWSPKTVLLARRRKYGARRND
jgi:hypothetical protein